MPLPAGTGHDAARASSRARPGSRSRSTAAARSRALALDDGIARGRGHAPANQKVLVSIFLNGGIDALSVLFPAGDPRTTRCGRRSRSRRPQGTPFAEDDRLRWHPAAGGLATLHAEGKVSVLQAVGYDNSDKSHFTARHYYEVGADRRAPAHRLARPLPRPGRHAGQPAAGADARRRRSIPRSRPRRCRSRRSWRADQYTFAPPGIAAASARGVDAAGGGEHRRGAREVDRRRACSRRARSPTTRTTSTTSSATSSTASTARSPTRARPTRSRTGSPGSRR